MKIHMIDNAYQITRLKRALLYTSKLERCGDCKHFKWADPDNPIDGISEDVCILYPQAAFHVDLDRGRCKKYEDYS